MAQREAPFGEHLLPSNATTFERALAAPTQRIGAVPVPLRLLWRPMECPASHLPWLAWALSVDVWDPAWDEATKRRVIAASMEIHRHKGTPGALKRALAALDLGVAVREWFETGGAPYTFRLDIDAARPLAAADYDIMLAVVVRAKNVRSWLDAGSGISVSSVVEASGSTWRAFETYLGTITIHPPVVEEISASGESWRAFAATQQTVTIYPA